MPLRSTSATSGLRRPRTRLAVCAVAVLTTVGLATGAGQAFAVDPTVVRDGCAFTSDADRAANIQTCWVWSESMQTSVTVKIRPSDQEAGESEQAVYFLGQLSDPSTNGRGDLYGTEYNLVAIPDSATTWSANWQSTPRDNDGNVLTTYEGGEFDPAWETFVGEELPAYLNEEFDISTSGNAISGLSISGGQAINLALKYPDVFSVAVSRSGYYQTDNIFGYLAVPFILATRQGVSNGFDALWGNPFLPGNTWAANDVAARIAEAKANGQTIIVSTGNGLPASQAEWDEMMAQGGILNVAIGVGLEVVSFASTLLLNAQADLLGLPIEFIYTDGAHTWNRWIRTDAEEVAKLEEALEKYAVTSPAATSTATTSTAAVSARAVSAVSASQSSTSESSTSGVDSASTPTTSTPEATDTVETEDSPASSTTTSAPTPTPTSTSPSTSTSTSTSTEQSSDPMTPDPTTPDTSMPTSECVPDSDESTAPEIATTTSAAPTTKNAISD
ncbi:alpha/beta hydrolase-fold protein [Gordonia sp. VNQ95]|uniref:alpha/beta hydrolase n=1 Tax=Gordonia sp. VNQ95 TaxID=3156619 RepID=UPI0032B62935